MAALNFPNSPSLNDTHTENGVTFKWNGAAWDRLGDIGAQGSAGAAGAQGAAGAAGAQGSTGPVAGSSNQVVYKDGSNNPAGSANFTFDGTNLTVSGNVSIGGALTYEDVTNIDSVGVITARSGIHITGTDEELRIYRDQGDRFGGLRYTGSLFKLRLPAADHFTVDDSSNNERLRITASGLVGINKNPSTYQLEVSGGSANTVALFESSDAISRILFKDNSGEAMVGAVGDALTFYTSTNATERLRITSAGLVGIDNTSPGTKLAIGGSTIDSNNVLTFGKRVAGSNSNLPVIGHHSDGSGSGIAICATSTDGKIHFFTGNGGAGFGDGSNAERMRIDASGNIGINDTAPSEKLNVGGNIMLEGSDQYMYLTNVGTGNAGIYVRGRNATNELRSHSTGIFTWEVTGSEKMRITSDGKVGVGVAAPDQMMEITNTGGTGAQIQLRDTSTAQGSNNGVRFGYNGSGAQIWNFESTYIRFATSNTERVRINSSGHFGIGTNNPSNRLHVYSSSNTGEIRLGGGNGSGNHRLFFQAHPSTAYIDSYGNNTHNPLTINASPLTFNTSGSGAVTFGTTTDNPGDGNQTTGAAIRSNGKYFFSCSADGGHINRNNAGYVIHTRYQGNHRGGVYVYPNATQYNTSSDYRLKENVVDISGAITRVKELAPRRFNFISEPDKTVDGFLAHEAATVVPEAITGTYNEVDGDGNPVYQCIDHARLVPLLTAALQEAIAKIETLEAAVTALQGS